MWVCVRERGKYDRTSLGGDINSVVVWFGDLGVCCSVLSGHSSTPYYHRTTSPGSPRLHLISPHVLLHTWPDPHSFPGFCRLRMHLKGGSPVAFVEFQDVRCAGHAMAALLGTYLHSSDRGAMRIEYAKSKMAEVGGPAPTFHTQTDRHSLLHYCQV